MAHTDLTVPMAPAARGGGYKNVAKFTDDHSRMMKETLPHLGQTIYR